MPDISPRRLTSSLDRVPNPPARPRERLIRISEVRSRTGLSRSTLYVLMAQGGFPRPVPLARRCVGWIEGEVELWIRSRMAQRPAPAQRLA